MSKVKMYLLLDGPRNGGYATLRDATAAGYRMDNETQAAWYEGSRHDHVLVYSPLGGV